MKVADHPAYALRPWHAGSDLWRWYPREPAFLGHVAGLDFWLTGSSHSSYITFRWTDDFSATQGGWGGYELSSDSWKYHSSIKDNPEALEFCRNLHLLHR